MPIRYLFDGCRLAALAALAMAAMHVLALAAVCERPAFTNAGGPLPIDLIADGLPRALVSGSFFQRGDGTSCACDLAAVLMSGSGSRLLFLRGSDDGTFARSSGDSHTIDDFPIAIAKLAADGGGLDRVVVLTGTGTMAGRVTVFAAAGNGQYVQQGPAVTVSAASTALAAGDFDGDGNADLAVTSGQAPQLTVLFGEAAGGFRPALATVQQLGGPNADHAAETLTAGRFFGDDAPEAIAVGVADVLGNLSVAFVRLAAPGTLEVVATSSIGRGEGLQLATARDISRTDAAIAAFVAADPLEPGSVKAVIPGSPTDVVDLGVALEHPPRSLVLADFNQDEVEDLLVSSYGSQASMPDGQIRILKGQAGLISFDPLFTTPKGPLKPKGVVTGTFGRDPGTGRRHIGIAAVNHDKMSAFVWRGDGAGAFVRPSGFRTEIVHTDARMFIVGDFHSLEGDSPLADLGYLWHDNERDQFMFSVLLADGNRGFRPSRADPLPVGRQPLLITSGRFDGDAALDIAVVDANPGDAQERPLLKIFRGEGEGRFAFPMGVSEFTLHPGDFPVAIVTGRFRDSDAAKPLDVAIVSRTPSGGRLTRFFNDGSGRFEREEPPPESPLTFSFTPGGLLGSSKFRPGGRFDFAVKRAASNTFVFLRNAGDGAIVSEETVVDRDGTPSALPRSDLFFAASLDPDGFDDIVAFDSDGTLDVFLGDGLGGFEHRSVDILASGDSDLVRFAMGDARFFIRDFGDGKPGLAGLVRAEDDRPAIVVAKGDGNGGFESADIELLEPPVSPERRTVPQLAKGDLSKPEAVRIGTVHSAFAGPFANPLLGNGLPDLGFLATVSSHGIAKGGCPGGPQDDPVVVRECQEITVPPPNVLPEECRLECGPVESHCVGACDIRPCTNPPCRPPFGTCFARPSACQGPGETKVVCTDVSKSRFCETTTPEITYLIVFGNTCGAT